MMLALTGCSPSFVRKDLGPDVSNAKKYGFMQSNLFYNGRSIQANPHIPFLEVMSKAAADEMAKSGITTEIIPENGDFAEVAVKFAEYAQKGRRNELNPDNEFKPMQEMFKKHGIEVLLISTSNASGQKPSFAQAFGTLAASIALKATAGAVFGGGSPTTYKELLAISLDGKVLYSDWGIYAGGLLANKGSITDPG